MLTMNSSEKIISIITKKEIIKKSNIDDEFK